MNRKKRKGYYVQGQFVHEGSELDQELVRQAKGNTDISRTDLKKESQALQALGVQLMEAPERITRSLLDLPDSLVNALDEGRKIKDFGARRRQCQFIGKLMRKLDEAQIESIKKSLSQ